MRTTNFILIARNEWVQLFRNRVVLLLAGSILLLLLVAVAGSYRDHTTVKNIRENAMRQKRQEWLQQDPKHPHIAAHFGTFAFKPKTALSLFDAGLDNYTGAYAYLEPHRQNDFVFKPAEGYGASIRFGQLSVALVLQLLVPLLIIFMGFASITQERQQGTLRLLFSNGASLVTIAAGKVAGQYTALLALLLPALVLTGAWFTLLSPEAGANNTARLLLLLAVYLVYFLLFTLLTVFVSAISRSAGNALVSLLTVWIVACILIPKAAANMASDRYPLPSQHAFREAVQKDIAQGINGHNTKDERAKQLEAQLLQQYHVSKVSDLPFNYEGYVMQAGEAYSSQVYDKHFYQVQQTLIRQDRFCRLAGLVCPYLLVQTLSMGVAATDLYTHINFQQQTETYRRQFVQRMNEDMMHHSKLGDWDYKASQAVYASVPAFTYTRMPFSHVLALYKAELFSLLVLLLVSLALFRLLLARIPLINLV